MRWDTVAGGLQIQQAVERKLGDGIHGSRRFFIRTTGNFNPPLIGTS